MTGKISLVWPVPAPPGSVLTSDFKNHIRIAMQNGYCYEPKPKAQCPNGYYYPALDLVTSPAIGYPVIAAAKSITHVEVEDQGDKGYGLNVRIIHADGYYTLYAHLSSIVVRSGDDVEQGQLIGYTGWSGNVWDSNGQKSPAAAHLHFELRKNGFPIDPISYLVGAVDKTEDKTTPVPEFGGAAIISLGGEEFQVITDYVNKRSEPSTRQGSQTVIGRLMKGEIIKPSRFIVYDAWLDLENGYCALAYQGNVYLVKVE